LIRRAILFSGRPYFLEKFLQTQEKGQKRCAAKMENAAVGWNLSEIPEDQRQHVAETLELHYRDLLAALISVDDEVSYPLVMVGGVLRWKREPWIADICDHDTKAHLAGLRNRCVIDLNRLSVASQHGEDVAKMAKAQRALYKRIGYSLSGYAEVFGTTAAVQGWAN
jgi:hypothetical protein